MATTASPNVRVEPYLVAADTHVISQDHDAWGGGVLLVKRLNHPWHLWLDEGKFGDYLRHVQSLGIEVLPSYHGPTIYGPMVDEAFQLLSEVPSMPRWEEPGQADLEAMLAVAGAPVDTAPFPPQPGPTRAS